MAIGFDAAIGVSQEALRVFHQRHEVLASNIANADTPHYKARDLDFRAALQEADGVDAPRLDITNPQHLADGGQRPGGELLYRVPNQPSLDGNTVDRDLERIEWAENVMRYQAALQFTSSKIASLKSAISGQSGG